MNDQPTPSPAPREPERLLSAKLLDFCGAKYEDFDSFTVAAKEFRGWAKEAAALESQLAAATRGGGTAGGGGPRSRGVRHRQHGRRV